MIPGLFVTGTGTDVGKTVTTTGVLRWLLQRSVDAMVMKPVQTGAPDIDFVLQAASLGVDEETLAHLSPYLYRPACSPHLAGRLAGDPVRMDKIVESYRWLAARHRCLVVEGAGGLLAPLNEYETMLDLAQTLGLPVLLVGHSGLGTINHVLLSLEALRQVGLKTLGVILNDTRPVAEAERWIHDDNRQAIESFGQVRVLACIPYLGLVPDWSKLDESLSACNFMQSDFSDQHREMTREGALKRELL
jgi:dethiobiotin synthase